MHITLTFEYHIVFFAIVDISRHSAGAKHCLQGTADLTDGDTKISGTIVIDNHLQLRLGLFVIPIEAFQPGIGFLDLVYQQITPLRQLGIGTATDNELHRFLDACTKALTHYRKGTYPGQITQTLTYIGHDVPCRTSFIPIRQHIDDDATVEDFKVAEGARRTYQ